MSRRVGLDVPVVFQQALAIWAAENPGKPANVSRICEMAGVNRSNVYRTHRELLDDPRIERCASKSSAKRSGRGEAELKEKIKQLQLQIDLLQYLWLEAAEAIDRSASAERVFQEIRDTAKLRVPEGKFLRRAVLSYLGSGTVSLAEIDILDPQRRKLLVRFLMLRSGSASPKLEDYDTLRRQLQRSGDTQVVPGRR